MGQFKVTPSGVVEDYVRVELAGQTLLIAEQYEFKQQFFAQPSNFSIVVGDGTSVGALIKKFPPRSPCAVRVGDVLQMTGFTDGYSASDGSGATTLQIRGRDTLASLIDRDAQADRSFSDMSWVQVTAEVFKLCGLTDFTIKGDNTAERATRASVAAAGGASVTALRTAANIAEMKRIAKKQTDALNARRAAGEGTVAVIGPMGGSPTREGITEVDAFNPVKVEVPRAVSHPANDKPLKIKAGENFGQWLRENLRRRAGLFLFAGPGSGVYILAQPNTSQSPLYRLRRQRGARDGSALAVNVLSVRHKNETTHRRAKYIVFGRAGSGHKGRSAIRGEFVDEEMVSLGYPLSHTRVNGDSQAKSQAQAEREARYLCAEDRRNGREYVAMVQGHTAPAISKPDARAVWTVDTIVEVLDDELGLRENMWISEVSFRRGPNGTTTELTLLRPDHMLYGEPEYS